MGVRTLFLDRDGTLVEEPVDNQVDSLDKIRLVEGVIPALLELAANDYRFVMVSNQDGLGTDSFPIDAFQRCQDFILRLFSSQGISFDQVFICPHLPEDGCECRKPRTGLLTRYLAASDLDLMASAVVGDRSTDMELAERIGVRGFLLGDGANGTTTWRQIVDCLCRASRTASIIRRTNETNISVAVNLDSEAPVSISTGIGFFDHMLEQIARHGGFSLQLECSGDLEVDEHHSVEDVAIALGRAIREALGSKRGIGRYGFVVPMDESEARVSLDLSGRGRFEFRGRFPRNEVGGLATEMVEHFFLSLADSLAAALHLEVQGRNTHHMVEACFKSVGRALRQAIRLDGQSLPTTKGVLS